MFHSDCESEQRSDQNEMKKKETQFGRRVFFFFFLSVHMLRTKSLIEFMKLKAEK